jgi:hypothetical protein
MAKKTTTDKSPNKEKDKKEVLYTKADEDAFFKSLKTYIKKEATKLVTANFPKSEGLTQRLLQEKAEEQVKFWLSKMTPDNVKAAMRLGFEIFRHKLVGKVKGLLSEGSRK